MKEEKLNIEKRLEALKDQNPFKVPENYFDDFAGRLKSRIATENKPIARNIRIVYYLKPVLSIAAVFAILFLAVYIPVSKTTLPDATKVANMTKSAGMEHAQQSKEQSDSYEALTMLPQSQFLSAYEEVQTEEEVPAIDPNALEEYLADNASDYDLLTSN